MCASKIHIHSGFLAGEDELVGNDPRQFANLENAEGGVIADRGGV